jgi:hypothetical protein
MQQASSAPTIVQVTPGGGIQVQSPLPMRPLTDREIEAIRERRSDHSTQLNSAADRRDELAQSLKDAPPGTETGILERIQLLDSRILQIERDLEESGRLLRTGMTVDNGTALVAPSTGIREMGMSDDTAAIIGVSFSVFFLLPLALGAMRLMFRRARRHPVAQPSPENDARMERLEQAVDAIALEIERVGESQRYQGKVLAEANLMPAMALSARTPEHLRAP